MATLLPWLCTKYLSANQARYRGGTRTEVLGRTGKGPSCLLPIVCLSVPSAVPDNRTMMQDIFPASSTEVSSR